MHDVFYISIETVSTRIKDLMYIAIYAIQVFFFQHQIKIELQQLGFNYDQYMAHIKILVSFHTEYIYIYRIKVFI